MGQTRVATMVLALAVGWTAAGAAQQTAEQRLQAGLYQEEVQGNLQQAITIYEGILKDHAANRVVAAKAQLHIGLCYETLGLTEAQRAYQRVLDNYADQSEAAGQARARLAALRAAVTLGGAPIARKLLTSFDSIDVKIDNPNTMVPSPDGRRVAYAQTNRQDAGVYVRDLASGEIQRVAAREPTLNGNHFSVVWSSDGRRLAFQQTDRETQAAAIRIFDLTTRETVAVPGLDARGLYLLDWSRDGRYILCNHERNTLELVTVADGKMITLSDSIWPGQRASLAPDGRFVAFARGKYGTESLYVQPLAGGPRTRVAESGGVYLHPLWSPDGQAIAYWRPDGIWLVPVTDGAPSGAPRLAYRTDTPRWPVAWTEGGGYYFDLNAERSSARQVAVDRATGQLGSGGANALPDYPEGLSGFAWSPDMQRVVFTLWSGGIRTFTADTRTMTSHDLGGDHAYLAWWSADGQEVFYYAGDPPSQTGQLKAVDLGSGRIRSLSPRIQGWVSSMSADRRRMVIMRRVAVSAPSDLVVAEPGQPDGRVVATGPAPDGSVLGGVWGLLSPSGDQVLYGRRGGAGQPGTTLWVVASDGGAPRQIATVPGIQGAVWDPSGRFIAYTVMEGSPKAFVLRIVEAATGVERDHLTLPSSAGWGITDWSGDGQFIGLVGREPWWEYWVVEGLQDGAR